MQNLGRIVDHCNKSMTEKMTETLEDDAQQISYYLNK